MKKVVSYSFFRHPASHYEHPNCGESQGRFFVNYLRCLIRAHCECWHGWELWIYHDDRAEEFSYWKTMKRLEERGFLRLFSMGTAHTLCGSMLWRIAPIRMPDVEYVVCRDVDSLPMPKDRRAVEEFVKSGRAIHVIHDSSSHSGIMGGTIALNVSKVGSWPNESAPEIDWNQHGADQQYLNSRLYPRFKSDMLLHELHHPTGLDCMETRTRVDIETPQDIKPEVAIWGDSFANGIGLCYDVEPAVKFYDSLGINNLIRECETA